MTNHPIPAGQVLVPVEAVLDAVRDYRDNSGGSASYRQACNHIIETVKMMAPVTPDTRSADVPVGDCVLCAGKCRGHNAGRPEEWEPEPGSAAYLAKSQPPQTADTDALREAAASFAHSHRDYGDDDRPAGWNEACDHIANAFRYDDNPFGRNLSALSPTHTVSDMGVDAGRYLADRFQWAAPGDQQEDTWLVRFCDQDCGDAIFTGQDAEKEAWAYWERYAPSFNIYVFRLAALTADKPEDTQPYLVWSNEHQAWWGKDRRGYTRHIERAGRYKRAEALTIAGTRDGGWHVRKGNPDEIAIPERDAIDQYAAITEALSQGDR